MTITCSSSIPSFHTDAPESARYSRNPDLAQKVMAHKVIERVLHQMGSRVGHTATFGHSAEWNSNTTPIVASSQSSRIPQPSSKKDLQQNRCASAFHHLQSPRLNPAPCNPSVRF
ncbi:hypothetical protein E2320_007043 [Naja naja]|nr:hypothetical protein E2320_007043 [Naja naja]